MFFLSPYYALLGDTTHSRLLSASQPFLSRIDLLFASNDPISLLSTDPRHEFYLTESHEDLILDTAPLLDSFVPPPNSLDSTLSFLYDLLDFG
jgi:hypothetical protein